jgi:hypothetical protein
MNYSQSQPDELAIVTQQMDEREINKDGMSAHNDLLNEAALESWHTGYVSPYRAAYFRNAN